MDNNKSMTITFILLLMAVKGNTQSVKQSFSSKLYFPFGIGYLNSPRNNLEGGIIVNMGAEYRFQSTHGTYLRLNVDSRSNSYKRDGIYGTNIVQGKIKFNDYLVGVGYRIGGIHKLRQYALLQGGLSVCEFQNVTASEQNYTLNDKNKTIPVIKMVGGMEFYVGKSSAITLEAGYIWHLKDTPFGQNHLNEGALGISIGFTSNLF